MQHMSGVMCHRFSSSCDKWRMIYGEGVNIVSKFQLPSNNGLGWQLLEDWEEKDHWVDESINELDGVGPVDNRPSTN